MQWKSFSIRKKIVIGFLLLLVSPVAYIFIARLFVEARDCSRDNYDFVTIFKEKQKSILDSLNTSNPNVIFILSDDQAWNHYSFYDHPYIKTPNLDKLAKESLVFSRGYVTAPLCSPSIASIITGLHPHEHGITGNDPVFEYDGLRADLVEMRLSDSYLQAREQAYAPYLDRFYSKPNIVSILDSMGYVSFQSGKWWLGSAVRGNFDEGMTVGSWECYGRHGDEGLKIGREGMCPIYDFLDTASQYKNTPFFLWYAPFMPHWPHTPPEDLLDNYLEIAPSKAQAKYWAMVEWFDQTIGQLLDYLEDKNLAENTIIVYVADNGWIQDSKWTIKSLTPAANYAPRSKRSPYEGGIRTPIMLKWPKGISPNHDNSSLVSTVDIVPTILDLLNLEQPIGITGISLVDHIQLQKRDAVFSADYKHDMEDFNDPKKSLESKTVIKKPWKLIVPNPANSPEMKTELYNIIEDETEQINLASQHPEIVTELSKLLEEWWD